MKTTINLPANLITNRVNASKVAILITIIVIAAMMIITTQLSEFEETSIIPSITIASTIAMIIASGVIAMSLKRIVYAKSESPIKCIEILFTDSVSEEILKAAADNRWSKIPALAKKESNGNERRMKLEIAYSKDYQFAAYQLFSYVPHTYEPCSQIFYIDKADIARINFSNLKS